LGNFEKIGTSAKKELRSKKEKAGAGRTGIEVGYMGGIHPEKSWAISAANFGPNSMSASPSNGEALS
jgi:hypothetical protein